MGKKGKGKPKGPPAPEPFIYHIESFASIETRGDSLSVTPDVVTPQPGQTPTSLAAEEDKTCGMMRMHITRNEQGKPEFQVQYTKPGDPDSTDQYTCEDRQREKRGDPPGWTKPPLPYDLEEHGLPHIQATGWMKEPLTFPVLNKGIDFRKINFKRPLLLDEDIQESLEEGAGEIEERKDKQKRKDQDGAGTSKAIDAVEKEAVVEVSNKVVGKTEHKLVERDERVEKSKDITGRRMSALDIWSSQRVLNEFMIYPVQVESANFAKKKMSLSAVQAGDDLLSFRDIQEEFVRQPFYATDKLTGKEIYVDPKNATADDNGYYTIYDPISGDNFVIDPPKLIVLDPITKKELVIDPRKPVGQYYAAEDPEGHPIVMDTSDQQPYIYTDPVSGASLLVDNKRVKPYTVIDPRTGAEVRIDPLMTDGKPYLNMDAEGNGYSILPLIPGGTPVLFDHPVTGDASILGGPVEIRDPVTGEMKYQEGPFTMRDPKTGQNMNQVGPILLTDPQTGRATLMSNPGYERNPQTGELTVGPSIVYKIHDDGKLIPVLPEAEKEKVLGYMKSKGLTWDEKLGVFIKPEAQHAIEEMRELREDEKKEMGTSFEKTPLEAAMSKNRSIESILETMASKPDRKRIRKIVEDQIEDQREYIRSVMAKKKDLERSYLQSLLLKKEKAQSLFIKNLTKHFGTRLKYYDKAMFAGHIKERVAEENKALTSKVEKKIAEENNRALDAMLIQLEKQKQKLLEASNMVGTAYQFSIGCKNQVEELCGDEKDPTHNNLHYKRTMEVYKTLKVKVMQLFNESLQRENELIRRELKMSQQREMAYLMQQVDELYVKICCQREWKYKTLKVKVMQLFNESLQRENELIRRELKMSQQREMAYLMQQVDELYVKICCQRFLLVK